jgi:hypothetical protein
LVPNVALPRLVMWVVIPFGQVTVRVAEVEIVAVELVITEVRVQRERPRLDQDPTLDIGEFGERFAGPVGGVG